MKLVCYDHHNPLFYINPAPLGARSLLFATKIEWQSIPMMVIPNVKFSCILGITTEEIRIT